MTRTHAVVDGPLGPVTVVGHDGRLAGLFLDGQRHLPPADRFGERDDTTLPALREQLGAFLAGDLRVFDVELAPVGTPFQAQVWAALRHVPYGTTTTYGELAAAVGRPAAVRAVGAANGRNPYCLVVPCHRVVGADGSLTGYSGGLERKRFLLDLERRGVPACPGSTGAPRGSRDDRAGPVSDPQPTGGTTCPSS